MERPPPHLHATLAPSAENEPIISPTIPGTLFSPQAQSPPPLLLGPRIPPRWNCPPHPAPHLHTAVNAVSVGGQDMRLFSARVPSRALQCVLRCCPSFCCPAPGWPFHPRAYRCPPNYELVEGITTARGPGWRWTGPAAGCLSKAPKEEDPSRALCFDGGLHVPDGAGASLVERPPPHLHPRPRAYR